MTLFHPATTRWFEILAPKMECAKSLGNLGRSGAVEVEIRPHKEELLNVRELASGLDHYRKLSKQYHRYWAGKVLSHAPKSHSPREILDRALSYIDAWRTAADPVIDQLQNLEEEHTNLGYCQRFLEAMQHSEIDFNLTSTAGPVFSVVNAILPLEAQLVSSVPSLSLRVEKEEDACILSVVATGDAEILQSEIKAVNGRVIKRPSWIHGTAKDALFQVNKRIECLEHEIEESDRRLDTLYEEHQLADTLGDVACLEWFLEEVGTLEPVGSNLVWITGWTTAEDVSLLGEILSKAGVPALVYSPPPPAGFDPPQVLRNPWWSRPFEIFARAFGTLGSGEVDPSPLLAVIVPLLFGYMFADVGQGLVLVAIGYWLRNRWESGKLLIVAGLSATIFGFFFGSLFSYEQLIPPLLMHPLHDPLLTLAIPLLFGALLLVLGQLLEGLESLWSGGWRQWILQHSGLLLLYLGAIASLMNPGLVSIALAGALWFVIGNTWYGGHWYDLFAAVGKLLEDGVRLMVNTLSFARVGAFALAHAGLSLALVALSESVDSVIGQLIIMVLGNVLIIVLEGLVVSIQTTRLVLFEFFMRFLHGTGRPFRPLAAPPNVLNVAPSNTVKGRI